MRLYLLENNNVKGKWTSSNPSVATVDYVGDLDGGSQYASIAIKKVGTTTVNNRATWRSAGSREGTNWLGRVTCKLTYSGTTNF